MNDTERPNVGGRPRIHPNSAARQRAWRKNNPVKAANARRRYRKRIREERRAELEKDKADKAAQAAGDRDQDDDA